MNAKNETLTVAVYVHTLEPGMHMRRRSLKEERTDTVEMPRALASEIRPDLGLYTPTVTFSAIERALRSMGYLDPSALAPGQVYYFRAHLRP